MNAPWLNYHHLYYFWTVARLGSISKASKTLRLAQPTVSIQLKSLETSLGHPLFHRVGRSLELTDVGHEAFRYCEDIFRLGKEFQLALSQGALARKLRLAIGVAEVVPKLVAEKLIQPALKARPGLVLDCREAPLSQLLSQLAAHELDVVLADAPASPQTKRRVFHHLLGECGISFVGSARFGALKKGFPHSLHQQPALMAAASSTIRHQLEVYFNQLGIEPEVVAEFEDTALLKVFGQRGLGFFVVPSAIEKEVCRQYDVLVLGRTQEVKEKFYVISMERRLKHPSLLAMVEAARKKVFET